MSVKLDIFHAVQRIIKTLPKGTVESRKFAKEVGLVFRKDGDVGEDRMFPTPDPECIESNLEQLLYKWKGQLSGPTLNAIENVRNHIRLGCLTGIPSSVGTTLNERLHRHLKRSMLCGASSVSPELAIPILALVLYVWTCRRRGLQKHANNQRVIPIIPFEFGDLMTVVMVIPCHLNAHVMIRMFKTKKMLVKKKKDQTEIQHAFYITRLQM